MKTICPHCDQEYPDIPDDYLGMTCECAVCNKKFVVEKVKYCIQCGTANTQQASGCRECGNPFGRETVERDLPANEAPSAENPKEAESEKAPEEPASTRNPLFEQAFAALTRRDFAEAGELIDELLEEEPHSGYTYFYRLMAECETVDELAYVPDLTRRHSWRLAAKYADETLTNTMKGIEAAQRQLEANRETYPDRWEELEDTLTASDEDGELLQSIISWRPPETDGQE